MTGDTTRFTDNAYLFGKHGLIADVRPHLYFIVVKSKGNILLQIKGAYEGQMITNLRSGDSISFKMASGKIISLLYQKSERSDYDINYRVTFFSQMIVLDDEEKHSLEKENIVFVRVGNDTENFDYDIPADKQMNLSKALNLFPD